LAAQAHRLNGTKVNIELPHAGQLSPVPNEQPNFFEQDFTANNAPDQRPSEVPLNKDTALTSEISLSKESGAIKADVSKKPIKVRVLFCYLFRMGKNALLN
jgi:hypothetical protein